ncbi:MAG: substrate-binding domain-containing protein [Candidatus Omnitrophica bacterium]|nr:substrate-binding domain-containing protein [Candidatus Omnitrophota bacterium]
MLFAANPWQNESLSYSWVTKNWLVDGVLILNILHQEKMTVSIKKLLKDDIPCVFINKYLGSQQVNAAGIDNHDGVTKVISHLVDLRHKRIGIINGGLMSVDGFERFEAYKKVLEQFGLKYNEKIVGYGDFNEEGGYEEMKRILYGSFKPTAMFCANDIMAIGAMRAIKEKGLRVPDDIAVVGFDDIEAAAVVEPPLTTIRPPLEDIGAKAIEQLIGDIRNNKKTVEEVSLKTKLIVRESSGA